MRQRQRRTRRNGAALLLAWFALTLFTRPGEGGDNRLRFDFGPGEVAPGFRQVLADTTYSAERGYGFDLGTTVQCHDRKLGDALTRDFCVGADSFFFSVSVPEGNYRVTATFHDATRTSVATVKAESRRLMVEKVEAFAGRAEARTFTVNVRHHRLSGGGEVRLKSREVGALHWDDKLTMEFSNRHAALAALEITPVEDALTVFLAGDSTVTDQQTEPWAAWGQMLPRFFSPDVAVANHAESGETLKAFIAENRLAKVSSLMKPGDYLFVQFNHNDQKPGSNHVEPFTSYKEHVKRFIAEARRLGATPVLVTSMLRRNFGADGKITNTLGDYPEALRQLARDENVALIDLHAASRDFYEALGPEVSKKAFVHYPARTFPGQDEELKDDTHFSPYGAYQLARAVVEGIRRQVPQLARHLAKVTPFDPKHPDPVEAWVLPPTPGRIAPPPAGR